MQTIPIFKIKWGKKYIPKIITFVLNMKKMCTLFLIIAMMCAFGSFLNQTMFCAVHYFYIALYIATNGLNSSVYSFDRLGGEIKKL